MIDAIDKQKEDIVVLKDNLSVECRRYNGCSDNEIRETNRCLALNIICHALVGIRQELMAINKYLRRNDAEE